MPDPAMNPIDEARRRRRTIWLAIAHAALALAVMLGFMYSTAHH